MSESNTLKREPRQVVHVRLAPAAIAVIDQMAEAEQRDRSQMTRVLLSEAVAARQRRQAR